MPLLGQVSANGLPEVEGAPRVDQQDLFPVAYFENRPAIVNADGVHRRVHASEAITGGCNGGAGTRRGRILRDGNVQKLGSTGHRSCLAADTSQATQAQGAEVIGGQHLWDQMADLVAHVGARPGGASGSEAIDQDRLQPDVDL